MNNFASFLERYGINELVVDETGNQERFDVKFSVQPENPRSLQDIITGIGLSLSRETRTDDILTLTIMSSFKYKVHS